MFRQTGKIPENLGLVFREFTQGYERYLKDDVRIESDKIWWKPVLQQLAWVMMQGEKPTEIRVAIGFEEAVGAIAQFLDEKVPYAEDFARKCLRDLQKYHLIQVGTNQEELEFRHQLIQEYYASEALFKQLPKLDDEQLKQEFLNFLKWTEPIALMLALEQSETSVLRIVELALAIDLMLGARLAREVEREFQKTTINLLQSQINIPDWLFVRLLVEIQSEESIPHLLELLRHDDPFVRVQVVWGLGKFGAARFEDYLIDVLSDSNSMVRLNTVRALEQLTSKRVIEGLIVLLNDPDPYVKLEASELLARRGSHGSKQALETLFTLLRDSSRLGAGRTQIWAADALGEIGSEILRSITGIPTNQVALELSQIQSTLKNPQEFFECLLELLNGEDSRTKMKDAEASLLELYPGLLSYIEQQSEFTLLRILDDIPIIDSKLKTKFRRLFLEYLKYFSRYSIQLLISSKLEGWQLGSEVASFEAWSGDRSRAMKTLRLIATKLQAAMYGHYNDIVGSAIYSELERRAGIALCRLGFHQRYSKALKLIQEDSYVKECVEDILSKFDAEKGSLELLEIARLEMHPRIRKKTVKILGEMIVEQKNLQVLEEASKCLHKADIELLGEIASSEAISRLVEQLQPELFDSQRPGLNDCVVEALGKIKGDKAAYSLPKLFILISTEAGSYALSAISGIQSNCKFYDYEVFQEYLKKQKIDRQTPQNKNRSPTIINNFPNAQKVQIFEQVDTYIENNYPKDPEIKKAIADLTLLLTQLQTQHPQVTTESQALTVLDAEFTEIQHSTTHPLVTLRQQLLNPERHLQAIKATLAEIAKHYLEESVWSKAAITYLDKMSETPDQGA